MQRTNRRSGLLIILAASLLAAACSDNTSEPATRRAHVVSVTTGERTLVVGDTVTYDARAIDVAGEPLPGKSFEWRSSNESVATVSSSGVVTALAVGTAQIAATTDERSGSARITVAPVPVSFVQLGPGAMTLEPGQTKQMFAIPRDAAGNELSGRVVRWATNNALIGTVSATGLLTAKGPGYLTITATVEGVVASVAATVSREELDYELLYHRDAGGLGEIFILDPTTGAAPFRLNAGTVSRQPSASPDGKRIAFYVSMQDVPTQSRVDDIYAVDRNGVNIKRLTTAEGIDDNPAWSPSGNRIAYRHYDLERSDIMVMNADGTGHTSLTSEIPSSSLTLVSEPAWSPDGSRIAYATWTDGVVGTTSGIWIMNADGSNKRLLTSTLTGFDGSPSWSPDGQRIVFSRYYGDETDLSFVSTSGGEVTRLPLPGRQFKPSWAPDGTWIAYVEPLGPAYAIYTVRSTGTDVRLRTINPAWGGGYDPTWILKQ